MKKQTTSVEYICDRCDEKFVPTSQNQSFHILHKDLCQTCMDEYVRWMAAPKCKKQAKEKTEYVAKVVGYSQHDCETWYACPVCGHEFGSWEVFHKGKDKKIKCSACGVEVTTY